MASLSHLDLLAHQLFRRLAFDLDFLCTLTSFRQPPTLITSGEQNSTNDPRTMRQHGSLEKDQETNQAAWEAARGAVWGGAKVCLHVLLLHLFIVFSRYILYDHVLFLVFFVIPRWLDSSRLISSLLLCFKVSCLSFCLDIWMIDCVLCIFGNGLHKL